MITSSPSPSIAENQTAVLTVTATDADVPAQIITYSITGGVDAALFSINGTTGDLVFNAAPDFENPTDANTDNVYQVDVTANDGDGGTTVQNLSVTVNSVNDNNPVFTSSDTPGVNENTSAVITVNANDADLPAQPVTYAISGGADAALFSVNGTTGDLAFNAAPDFENPTDANTTTSIKSTSPQTTATAARRCRTCSSLSTRSTIATRYSPPVPRRAWTRIPLQSSPSRRPTPTIQLRRSPIRSPAAPTRPCSRSTAARVI